MRHRSLSLFSLFTAFDRDRKKLAIELAKKRQILDNHGGGSMAIEVDNELARAEARMMGETEVVQEGAGNRSGCGWESL